MTKVPSAMSRVSPGLARWTSGKARQIARTSSGAGIVISSHYPSPYFGAGLVIDPEIYVLLDGKLVYSDGWSRAGRVVGAQFVPATGRRSLEVRAGMPPRRLSSGRLLCSSSVLVPEAEDRVAWLRIFPAIRWLLLFRLRPTRCHATVLERNPR